jgi:N-acetylglutamate synthase-like GNAT family acetyltransferase
MGAAGTYTAIRRATLKDVNAIRELSRAASRRLCIVDYTLEQVETALRYGAGIDQQVVADGNYYVIESAAEGIIAGGGWSDRAPISSLSNGLLQASTGEALNPETDAARIRGFCVHPDHTRRGLGRALLGLCERKAAHAGFWRVYLVATVTARRLYLACGFADISAINHVFPNGVSAMMHRMSKVLDLPAGLAAAVARRFGQNALDSASRPAGFTPPDVSMRECSPSTPTA